MNISSFNLFSVERVFNFYVLFLPGLWQSFSGSSLLTLGRMSKLMVFEKEVTGADLLLLIWQTERPFGVVWTNIEIVIRSDRPQTEILFRVIHIELWKLD